MFYFLAYSIYWNKLINSAHQYKRMAGAKRLLIMGPKDSHAPIMTLFFIWRLHGKPRHGYSLIKDMREIAIPICKPSTVYALLAKLERAGLVRSRLDESSAHARKLYQTTAKGWELLQNIKNTRMKGIWREFIKGLLS